MGSITDLKQLQRRLVRHSSLWFSLRPYLGILEKAYLNKPCRSQAPQIFILGLPRSGTTVVYQYIVHRLHVAYLTNGAGYYYLSPCLITTWQKKRHGDYKSDFHSHYGKVTGPVSPREGGAFWGRFFDVDHYTNYADIPNKKIKRLKATICCIQNLFGDTPFVNKNVKHMLRLNALSKLFPDAYFIVVERQIQDVALSVLRGRYKNQKNPADWWSVKPENYARLKDLPPAEQIVNQLFSLKNKMANDLATISSNRIFHIQYENFCSNPELIIDQLRHKIANLAEKNPPESSFEISVNKPETDEERQLIQLVNSYVTH